MKGAEAELHSLARARVTGKPKTDPFLAGCQVCTLFCLVPCFKPCDFRLMGWCTGYHLKSWWDLPIWACKGRCLTRFAAAQRDGETPLLLCTCMAPLGHWPSGGRKV